MGSASFSCLISSKNAFLLYSCIKQFCLKLKCKEHRSPFLSDPSTNLDIAGQMTMVSLSARSILDIRRRRRLVRSFFFLRNSFFLLFIHSLFCPLNTTSFLSLLQPKIPLPSWFRALKASSQVSPPLESAGKRVSCFIRPCYTFGVEFAGGGSEKGGRRGELEHNVR